MWHFLKSICVLRSGGYIEVKPQYFEQIPIPIIDDKMKLKLSSLSLIIFSAKKENPAADTSSLEAEIDQLVYRLYGLTEEEIKIIETSTDSH